MATRTEYRVVGEGVVGGALRLLGGNPPVCHLPAAERRRGEYRRRQAFSNIRIQTRSVTETPWVDLPESKQGVDRG